MYDGTEQDLLRLLASRAGISPEYHDIAGTLHVTSDETRRAILSAMGFQVGSGAVLSQELTALDEAPWQQPCDPILILQQGDGPTQWTFRPALEEGEEQHVAVAWSLTDEKGTIVHREETSPGLNPCEVRSLAGRRMVRVELPLVQNLGLGYYDLSVGTMGSKVVTRGTLRVVVAPPHCFVPEELARGGRV
ncbi:MAG TPA: hypothetical protein PK614_09280, partial [Nitrospira sp.]|nr:hypothetical protein [Nitrospira sp.]